MAKFSFHCQNYKVSQLGAINKQDRLSSKNIVTRAFVIFAYKFMPIILQRYGFDVQSYKETTEKKVSGLSAKEYNNLVEQYNSLQNANNDLKIRYKYNLKEYESRQNISR